MILLELVEFGTGFGKWAGKIGNPKGSDETE